jgi:uncharacterized protein YxeA
MYTPRNKKNLLIILTVIICAVGAVATYKNMLEGAVYTRTVTPEDGPLLSESMQAWIADHRTERKISAYAYIKDGVYELLLLDNRNDRENQYVTTDISTKLHGNDLHIKYTDTAAVSEGNIHYNEETYLILRRPPSLITISVDGVERILQPEIGDSPITQP